MSDFKSRRKAAGFTQSGLAKAYGDPRIDKYLISKIESGIVPAPPELDNFVLKACGCNDREIHEEDNANENRRVATQAKSVYGSAIAHSAQIDSLHALGSEREKRYALILDYLRRHGSSTSREIAYGLGFSDLNAVKPRLTELKENGRVRVTGTKLDIVTERRVSVWELEEGENHV